MSNLPLVTVIIPAYNCAKYITETLTSLFHQDYPNIEIVVVNDGSKDNTLDILKRYGDKIVVIDQPNTGAPGARNTGIRAAKGEFIAFCDADDIWASQKVRSQVTYLNENPNIGMVFCDWHVWEPDDTGRFSMPDSFGFPSSDQEVDLENSGWVYHKLLLDCICLTSTVMFRKEIIASVGSFDTSLWNGDDYDYWLRTSRITEIHKLKSKLVLYRILPQSVARTPTQIHYEYEVLRNAISRWGTTGPNGEKNDPKAMRDRLARLRFGFGYLHFHSGDPMIAMKCFLDSMFHKPHWYVPWAYLFLALWRQFTRVQFSLTKVSS